jgi:hypothetical protein
MKKIIRHGDVIVEKFKGSFEGKEVTHNGSFVLAYGETTGHKHLLTCERMMIKQDINGRYFLHLETEGRLSHEEHKTLTIPAGDYLVGAEQEMDWFQKVARKVID